MDQEKQLKSGHRQNLSAEISEMTTFGDVKIKFNTTMVTEGVILDEIDETVLSVYVEVAEGRELDEDFKLESVNLTFQAVKYDHMELDLKIIFDKPVELSPLTVQDRLVGKWIDGNRLARWAADRRVSTDSVESGSTVKDRLVGERMDGGRLARSKTDRRWTVGSLQSGSTVEDRLVGERIDGDRLARWAADRR